jgi:hypothetical protein
MTDTPHPDPAEHARDFARRYAEPMDYHASQRMIDLGIPLERIGMPDPYHGIRHAAFHPDYPSAGGVSPDGRIVVEGGIFNPSLMNPLGTHAGEAWANARLRDRLDAVVAHEYEEHASGSHGGAVARAATSALPISHAARELLRTISEAEREATRRGDPNPLA